MWVVRVAVSQHWIVRWLVRELAVDDRSQARPAHVSWAAWAEHRARKAVQLRLKLSQLTNTSHLLWLSHGPCPTFAELRIGNANAAPGSQCHVEEPQHATGSHRKPDRFFSDLAVGSCTVHKKATSANSAAHVTIAHETGQTAMWEGECGILDIFWLQADGLPLSFSRFGDFWPCGVPLKERRRRSRPSPRSTMRDADAHRFRQSGTWRARKPVNVSRRASESPGSCWPPSTGPDWTRSEAALPGHAGRRF